MSGEKPLPPGEVVTSEIRVSSVFDPWPTWPKANCSQLLTRTHDNGTAANDEASKALRQRLLQRLQEDPSMIIKNSLRASNGDDRRELFDPYYTWLSIPPAEQPADFYRLFALKQFEADREVISRAVDQRMAYIRSFNDGQHAREYRRLVNELSKAAGCLLNPRRQAIYDQHLRTMQIAEQHERALMPPTAAELARSHSYRRKSVQPPPRPRSQLTRVRWAILWLLISGAVMALLLSAGLTWLPAW